MRYRDRDDSRTDSRDIDAFTRISHYVRLIRMRDSGGLQWSDVGLSTQTAVAAYVAAKRAAHSGPVTRQRPSLRLIK